MGTTKIFKRTSAASETLWAYLFVAPVVLSMLLFHLAPAFASAVISFTDWNGLTAASFVSLDNYKELLRDPVFLRSLWNTFYFTAVSVPLSIVLATLVAVMLNTKISGVALYRTVYFIPVITMPVAVGVIWRWLYNSEYGLINTILAFLDLPQPHWLTDPVLAMPSVIAVSVWSNVGYNLVILLAGLQGISQNYYEAAEIDGASRVQQFFKITVPLLTPTLFFVLIISLIQSFQVFDLIYIMMGKANTTLEENTRTVVYGVWEQGFEFFKMGYASAQAIVLFLVIFVFTMVQIYFQKKWVHY